MVSIKFCTPSLIYSSFFLLKRGSCTSSEGPENEKQMYIIIEDTRVGAGLLVLAEHGRKPCFEELHLYEKKKEKNKRIQKTFLKSVIH